MSPADGAFTPRRSGPELALAAPAGAKAALSDGEWVSRAALRQALEEARRLGLAEGEVREREISARALAAQAGAHEAECARVEREAVQRERAAHAHGFHKAGWMFGFGGFAAGALVVFLIGVGILQAGTESTVRGAAAGSMIRAQEQLERDVDRWERGE